MIFKKTNSNYYMRECYMCTNKDCCHMEFFNAANEHSTRCPKCGTEMRFIVRERVSFEQEERRKKEHEAFLQRIENGIISNIPKCPVCGSPNIRKISGIERGTSVLTLGLFSRKINKSFKCNNCGMTF